MNDRSLRKALIKLAHDNRELRPHLLPLLRTGARQPDTRGQSSRPLAEFEVDISQIEANLGVERGTFKWSGRGWKATQKGSRMILTRPFAVRAKSLVHREDQGMAYQDTDIVDREGQVEVTVVASWVTATLWQL